MQEERTTKLQELNIDVLKKDWTVKLFLPFFLKQSDEEDTMKVRTGVGKLSGLVGIVCNVLLAVSKLIVGLLASSMSITADALNNFSDATSSIVTLIGFKLAEKPADEDHPYGHARFEYLSGLAVAVLIILIGFELAKGSVDKIVHPIAVDFSMVTAGVLLVSILVKLWMWMFNKKLGTLIGSQTLIATAADSRNDVLTTGAVLIAAIVEHFTQLQIDGYMGLLVALFIFYSGASMAKDTISPLLGEATNPELKLLLVEHIQACPKVLGCHDLMVHDYGPGQRFASIHVEMDKDEDPLVCHEYIDNIERECLENYGVHLVIHYDPIITNDPELERMRQLVTAILKVKDERISIHDFRMVPGKEHTNLIFDVVLPTELKGQEKGIKSALEAALNDLGEGTYFTVITFDSMAFN